MSGSYRLPGNPSRDKYLIPVSGGADSTALAVLMHEVFPEIHFELCFTDTKAEEPGIYKTLDVLEQYIQRPILRIESDLGLFVRTG